MKPESFQKILLDWYDRAGRRNLPWLRERTPYRVWVSEIMLQQTRATTVIPYFERFMAAFPSLKALAAAEADQVMQMWSGLGYYSRARNLHRTARLLATQHGGAFPTDLKGLIRLPGIGQSTAGAILSLGFGIPAPILDGNVKRLWTRLHGITTWPGEPATQRRLWELSGFYLPRFRPGDYTQALMDFGATVCSRNRPSCGGCPLGEHCRAYRTAQVKQIPAPAPQRRKPVRQSFWLLLRDDSGRLCLQQRPLQGIWPGLWSFPQWDTLRELEDHCATLGISPHDLHRLPTRRHTFTHFHLDYTPVSALARHGIPVANDHPSRWIQPEAAPDVAVPAPVRSLITELAGVVT